MVSLKVLRNTPLRPLAHRMADLVEQCEAFDVATAFVSQGAVNDVLVVAAEHKPQIRFLTGTFGNNTRKATFKSLLDLQRDKRLAARVWRCAMHGDYHEKLYLWRMPRGRAVAWIGSANLTDGGLQCEGELVVELRGAWTSEPIRALRRAFETEWQRAEPLAPMFLDTYAEAKRRPPDFAARRSGRKRASRRTRRQQRSRGVFVACAWRMLGERAVERIERLLGGTAENSFSHHYATLKNVRVGDRGIYFHAPDSTVCAVEVTDVARDGSGSVFAYVPVFGPRSWRVLDKSLRAELARAGLVGARSKKPRPTKLSDEVARRVVKVLYPRMAARW